MQKSEYDDSLLLTKEINLSPSLSKLLHLERDLKPILQEIYQKNIELEVTDHKITWWGFLKAMVDSIQDHDTFDLPTIIEEERWLCYEPPLTGCMHQKFRLYLIDAKHPQKWVFLWSSTGKGISCVSYIFPNFLY